MYVYLYTNECPLIQAISDMHCWIWASRRLTGSPRQAKQQCAWYSHQMKSSLNHLFFLSDNFECARRHFVSKMSSIMLMQAPQEACFTKVKSHKSQPPLQCGGLPTHLINEVFIERPTQTVWGFYCDSSTGTWQRAAHSLPPTTMHP